MTQAAAEAVDISVTGDVKAQGTAYKVHGLALQAGADVATCVLRSGGAAGTVLNRISCPINDTRSIFISVPIAYSDGIHATFTGTAPTAQVFQHKVAGG